MAEVHLSLECDAPATVAFAYLDDCRIESSVEYHFPGGLAGRALEKVVEPIVAIALRHVERTIRENVEAQHATSQ